MPKMSKKFIASIYLFNGCAVKSLTDNTVVCDDPILLAKNYSDSNVDEIIVFDKSPSGDDAAHEKALDIIKGICKAADVNVYGAGNVKRMEDIKKLLYAGCKKACLNFSKEGNIEIISEVSEKFGKDKICICFSDEKSVSDNKELVCKYATELFFITNDENALSDEFCKDFENLRLTAVVDNYTSDDTPLNYLLENEKIDSISGNILNDYISKVIDYKDECVSKNIPIERLEAKFNWESLKKNSDGMVPVIVQDYRTDQVLMLAYMNEEAYNKTLSTGKMTYFSRSRNELWIKGETSSHYQYVYSLTADCDFDTILAKVRQIGAACHTGSYSCFFNEIAKKDYTEKNPQKVLDSVFDVIQDRKVNPREGSYTNYLFDKGLDKILKKVGEEATEMVIAAKNPDSNEIVYEMSDFLYHMMVLMAEKNVSWEDVTDELSRR